MTTLVTAATSPEQLRDVRELMRAFIAWHGDRHRAESALIDRYFDPKTFEAELQGLPGEFAPPAGRLLLATADGNAAGCVALRDLGDGACEMKRMFVHTRFQGSGVGRALVQAILVEARSIGYARMRLDTGPKQVEALGLYRSVGFRPIPPYYEAPPELRDWLVFMELELA
jgi:putative acetyltransferase